jgi:outer membrane lipoprotein LolB
LTAALLLAACATTPLPRAPLDLAAQGQALRALPGFQLNGRTAVAAAGDGFNATVSWRQAGEQSILKLSGPVGGSLTVTWRPGYLRVVSSRGEVLQDAEAEQAVVAQLGFMPPFEALRYWVLGLAAPGEVPTEQQADEAGRPAHLAQQQWQIRYERWTGVALAGGLAQLPQRLTATRGDVRLRVFVDKWKL